MKLRAHYLSLGEKVSNQAIDKLWELFPECRWDHPTKRILHIKISIEDPRFTIAQNILLQDGLKIRENHFGRIKPDEFQLELERVYDPSDWESAEFLLPSPYEYFVDYKIDSQGCVRVENDSSINRPAIGEEIIGDPNEPRLFLAKKLRADIETQKFPYLQFQPTFLEDYSGKSLPWSNFIEEYWAVTSDFILPPANWSNMVNAKGEPYTGDPTSGCYIVEGVYTPGEIHYRRESLKNLPRFGLALAHEMFGPGRLPKRNMLIASKEFYRFCTDRHLKMNWIPVRIDD